MYSAAIAANLGCTTLTEPNMFEILLPSQCKLNRASRRACMAHADAAHVLAPHVHDFWLALSLGQLEEVMGKVPSITFSRC